MCPWTTTTTDYFDTAKSTTKLKPCQRRQRLHGHSFLHNTFIIVMYASPNVTFNTNKHGHFALLSLRWGDLWAFWYCTVCIVFPQLFWRLQQNVKLCKWFIPQLCIVVRSFPNFNQICTYTWTHSWLNHQKIFGSYHSKTIL